MHMLIHILSARLIRSVIADLVDVMHGQKYSTRSLYGC
jgi:hypothetical protein